MCNELKYSAKLTGESFLLQELKIVAKLKKEGYSDKEIRKKILDDNLFQYKVKSSTSKRLTTLIRRVNVLNEKLIDRLIENPLEDGIIINLYAIMKNDRLFFEFMNEVMRDKLLSKSEILEKKDINIFFDMKIEQSENISTWADATISKIKQVIKKILSEANVIEDAKAGTIHKIIMSNWLKDCLIELGEEKYIIAMGEKI